MDNRLTALETKWDAVIPTLATKADLDKLECVTKAEMAVLGQATKADIAELRADVHKTAASLKTWAMATLIAMLGFQTGLMAWFTRAHDAPHARTLSASDLQGDLCGS
ncbi:hypothetical protein SAMN05216359_109123 [Roseateles sp. YR242]|uniref:hypothetical protein n=1 Tax=Roseateles sp. YR242 TaxID=1855305 RepID=UPI0008B490A0|nr:hypothetical protein [Roseateles sp. YR242]SEL45262.1 hypothetical protein SAMN05216359_109123 [Roseateles sp. YR242]